MAKTTPTQAPKRFPDRDEVAAVRAEAERLEPGLDGAARSHLPCVLLTNNERNLSFYRAHGFDIVLEGETPPGGPHAWAMVRTP